MAADVVNLFPSIPHEVGLRALREALHKRDEKIIPTEKLLKMVEFVLTTNYFEFENKTTICTTIPVYFTSDLEDQHLQRLVWLRFIVT